MTDFFSLFDEPRRPWLDPEPLKVKFLALSARFHPDRVHGAGAEEKVAANQNYAELNAAYNCLRDPKERLLHLLELELGSPPKDVQRIPPGTMDLFMEVGQLCREVDAFVAEKSKVTSPLLKVQMFQRGMVWMDKLNELQRHVNLKREELESELVTLNKAWENAPASGGERHRALPLDRLEQVYRVFSYVGRWNEQIQERTVQLSF